MRPRLLALLLPLLGSPLLLAAPKADPVDYVTTMMGTMSKHLLSTGNTYPTIALPWGMNFWTPQTGKMGDGWIYTYTADKIRGLRQTHQPSPWMNDYGQFSIMAVSGDLVYDEEERASWFSHKAEVARPYYYSVYLADHDITAELAPTERAAHFRFTFPEAEQSYIIVDAFDAGSYVRILPEQQKIVGYTTRNSGGVPEGFRNYFVLQFDRAFEYRATVADHRLHEQLDEAQADHTMGVVGFKTSRGDQVQVRVASSFISLEQAELNLRELGERSLEEVRSAGRARWNDILGRIQVEDPNVDNLRTFYSCLYRSVLFPRVFHEIDAEGRVVHYSPYNGEVRPGYLYTDTGFWDTFRSLFPLLNLVYPSVSEQYQQSLVNTYLESGFLPEWSSPGHRDIMIGNNSTAIVADAWTKGIRGQDIETLWAAVTHGAHSVHPEVRATGRYGHEYYDVLGYVPYDVGIHENAARTLEYAYNDWCIHQLGRALGKSEQEIGRYAASALNYRHLYDPEHRLMRGRNQDGTFQSPFNPLKWGDAFTEGNSWHYTWSVFHDPQGLIDLMGGRGVFNQMLDSVFNVPPHFDESYYGFVIHEIREMQIMNMGNYAHGNQPAQHMIYLYNYSGEPWKAQHHVREVMDRLYSPTPDGYCGDEDNGQTSAWYVFSALGFYPVCPGSDQYVLGSPLFEKVRVNLENGQTILITADDNGPKHRYVEALRLNGSLRSANYITHEQLKDGATLHFTMSDHPNTTRGITESDAPYSFSKDRKTLR